MRILVITPAPEGSKAGNRATAERWAGLLGSAGHQVRVVTAFEDQPCDLVIALHAWRSHDAILNIRQQHPGLPLILTLTGTDIYHHQFRYPRETLRSMELADVLIGLHRYVARDIPPNFGHKLVTVLQSAEAPATGASSTESRDDIFSVCVIGHMRDEKDSLRAALAARLLPEASRIHVIAAGKAHNPEWERKVRDEADSNPRFTWAGELERPDTLALLAGSQMMVISSRMEGGANVVSEACRAGIPILASDISGNRGLLGDDYPGYFRTGDERDLAEKLLQAEKSPEYLASLTEWVERLAPEFTPEKELAALEQAISQTGH